MDPDEQPKPEGTSIPVQFVSSPEPETPAPVEPAAPVPETPATPAPTPAEQPAPEPEPPVPPAPEGALVPPPGTIPLPEPETPAIQPDAALAHPHPGKARGMMTAVIALVVFAALIGTVTVLAHGRNKPKPAPASQVPPAPVVYTDAKTGFKVTRPIGWDTVTPAAGSSDSVEFRDATADPVGSNFAYHPIVTVSTASSGGASLTQVVTGINTALAKQTPGYKNLGSVQETVAGLPATMLTYSYNFDASSAGAKGLTVPLTSDELIIIKGTQGYIVRGTALTSTWAQHKQVIENAILGFQP